MCILVQQFFKLEKSIEHIYIFQELEFTGVMRFYYQAQDLGSGQKVGHVQIFSGHNKSVPHSRPVLYCYVLFVSGNSNSDVS